MGAIGSNEPMRRENPMSDKRLTAALCKMAGDNDHEALNALRMATTMLADRGSSWAKIAEMLTGRQLGDIMAPAGRQTPTPSASNDPWSDMFADIFGGAGGRTAAQPQPRPRASKFHTAREIPAYLWGTVHIVDERAWSGGDMLIVNIHDRNGVDVYGPMTIFDAALSKQARAAADRHDPQIVSASIRQPANSIHNPVINHMSVV